MQISRYLGPVATLALVDKIIDKISKCKILCPEGNMIGAREWPNSLQKQAPYNMVLVSVQIVEWVMHCNYDHG